MSNSNQSSSCSLGSTMFMNIQHRYPYKHFHQTFNYQRQAEIIENMVTALNSVKTLRSSVGQVFGCLGDGVKERQAEEGKENRFLIDLQDYLESINKNLRDVEQAVNALCQFPEQNILANTSFLSHECTQERLDLYSQLVLSYKWTNKLHQYSNLAIQQLNQNNLRRSYFPYQMGKRRRPPLSCHNIGIQSVEALLAAINRQFSDMNLTLCSDFSSGHMGSSYLECPEVQLTQLSLSRDYQRMIPQVVIVHVTLGNVLQVLLTLKGTMIEWVQVKGFGEIPDLWTESRYKVFRKVSESCNAAMLHFHSPTVPDYGIRSFMTWLYSYLNLFSDPCKGCGNYLQNYLPPTTRDQKTLEPYHEECRLN